MRITVFDLATVTGWAYLDSEDKDVFSGRMNLQSGSKSFRLGNDENEALRNYRARIFFNSFRFKSDLFGYERIQFPHKSTQASRVYFGLEAMLLLVALDNDIDVVSCSPQQIKKEATWKGNGKKNLVLAAARAQWPEQHIEDDNQADALWLMKLVARRKGISMGKHVEELFEV